MRVKLLLGLGFKFGFVPFCHFPVLWRVTRSLAGSRLSDSGENAKEWERRESERHAKRVGGALALPSFLPVFFLFSMFALQRTRPSRSLEQATRSPFTILVTSLLPNRNYKSGGCPVVVSMALWMKANLMIDFPT